MFRNKESVLIPRWDDQALVHTTGEDAIEHVTKILDNLDEKKDNKKKPFQTENNHQAFVNSVKSSIRNNN